MERPPSFGSFGLEPLFPSLLSPTASDRCALRSLGSRNAHARLVAGAVQRSSSLAWKMYRRSSSTSGRRSPAKMHSASFPPLSPQPRRNSSEESLSRNERYAFFTILFARIRAFMSSTAELDSIRPPLFLYSPGKNRSANRELEWKFGGPSSGSQHTLDGSCLFVLGVGLID